MAEAVDHIFLELKLYANHSEVKCREGFESLIDAKPSVTSRVGGSFVEERCCC
jgi:hypothetical protein